MDDDSMYGPEVEALLNDPEFIAQLREAEERGRIAEETEPRVEAL